MIGLLAKVVIDASVEVAVWVLKKVTVFACKKTYQGSVYLIQWSGTNSK